MKTNKEEAIAFEHAISRLFGALNRFTTMDPITLFPIAQVRFMRALRDGSRTPTELAEAMRITAGAITQLADRLVKAGMVVREEDPKDRRVRRLSLSDKGRQMMEERQERRVENAEKIISTLSPQEREEVFNILDKLVARGRSVHQTSETNRQCLSAELATEIQQIQEEK